MFSNSPSLTDGAEIIAFDYENVEMDEKELNTLKSLLQKMCEVREQTYIEANMDELIQMGYIEQYELENGGFIPNAFPNGFLVRITTVSVDETVIVADMSMWRGSLSAYGSTYTATYKNGLWEVLADGFWVS